MRPGLTLNLYCWVILDIFLAQCSHTGDFAGKQIKITADNSRFPCGLKKFEEGALSFLVDPQCFYQFFFIEFGDLTQAGDKGCVP